MPVSEKVEVRVALDADLMQQAQRLDLDLSQLLEASVRRALSAANALAGGGSATGEIDAFDRYIEENGPFYRLSERR